MSKNIDVNITPTALKTNGRVDPIGIDMMQPLFQWKLVASRPNSYQSAYRIVVVNEQGEAVWDTEKIQTDRQLQIAYAGQTLCSMTRYRWRVMVWDQEDTPSDWSDEASFETGLLDSADWKAQWIGSPFAQSPFEGLNWIGVFEEEKVTFQKTIHLTKEVQQVVLDAVAYANWELYCNDVMCRQMNATWRQDYTSPIRYADLTEFLEQGTNQIRFCISAGEHGVALAAKLCIRYADGTEEQVVTDESWQAVYSNHTQPATVVGTYGDAPWGAPVRRGAAPLFRKEFQVIGAVDRARLYVCGLGYENSCINGQPVSDGVLRGEYTQFDKTVYYNTMDVTALLQQGTNCLGTELGRGYYAFGKDWIGVINNCTQQQLLAQLEIRYADGTRQTVCSDATWQTASGPTVDDSIWYGDKYDARLEQDGWNMPNFDAHGWQQAVILPKPNGVLKSNFMPPIRVTETLQPTAVTFLAPKKRLYDFGKVTTGWVSIRVNEPTGTRIRLRYGEKLKDNGEVDMHFKDGVFQFWEPAQEDIYICRGDREEVWAPQFSYKGFRYVEIEGVDHEITVIGLALHNDLERTGRFQCSNELFNQIHGIITPTILNNFHSIPTDTPTYEKRGWTGDGQSISDTALINLDAQLFFRKWLQDLADSQNAEGAIPDTCPGPVYCPPAPEWMCAMVVIPYQLYMHCGDEDILRRYYPEMKRYMEYEIHRLSDGLSSNLHYGDWNSPAGSRPPEGSTFNATCFVFYICTLMRDIALALNQQDDAAYYDKAADGIKDTLNRRFFDEETMLYHTENNVGFRQTPTVLPLAFGIVPEEKQEAVAVSLAKNIREKDNSHLSTGCMGLKFLAPTLTRFGQGSVANAIVDRTDCPSWGYWISKGATTCWETWDTDSRSYNHFYFGTIDNWFYQYLAGIQPTSAGYKTFTVKPYLVGDLTDVSAEIGTPYGNVRVDWHQSKSVFSIEVDVPVNADAEIIMPSGTVHRVGSGRWHYEE